jgi:hypothetical protein
MVSRKSTISLWDTWEILLLIVTRSIFVFRLSNCCHCDYQHGVDRETLLCIVPKYILLKRGSVKDSLGAVVLCALGLPATVRARGPEWPAYGTHR